MRSRPLILLCLFSLSLVLTIVFTSANLPSMAQPWPPQERLVQAPTEVVPTHPLDAGRFYYRQGQYAAALAAWQQAADEFAQQGDRAHQALSLSYVSMVYQDLGDWVQAEAAIAQSLALLNQTATLPPAILLAQALNTQASLQFHHSQFHQAHQTWAQAAIHYTEAGDELGAWGAQINQAQALKELGFYRRATQELREINRVLRETPDSELKVTGLRTLGTALQAVGNIRGSYAVLAESLAIAQRLNLPTQISGLHTQIGRLAWQLGDRDRALAYFHTAAQEARHPSDRLQAELSALTVYRAGRQGANIGKIATQIYEQLVTLPPSRTQIYGAINLAHQVRQLAPNGQPLSLGQLDRLLMDAIATAHQFQDQRAAAHAWRERGDLYTQAQQRDRAIEFTQNSLNLARSLQADDVLAPAAWQLARLRQQQGERDGAIAAYTEAVASLQALRGDLVAIDQDLQFSFREAVEPVYRELVSLLLEGQPSQAELERARTTIEGLQLAELDNYFQEACLDAEAQEIDQVDAAATVFYPIILPDKFAVIVAHAGQPLRYFKTDINQAQVEQKLHQLLADLHPSADEDQRLKNAQQVYNWLIQPAQAQGWLKDTETLVFVLDGVLRNVPMAVLHDGEKYLLENYAIALSPGLQLLQGQSLDANNFATLVGGISEARGRFSALPEVEREVTTITAQTESKSLLNAEFTSTAVSQAVQNHAVDVVHLATHGQFSSNPEDTFFLTWEGEINVRELADILQSRQRGGGKPIELLVLSACETATGDDRATLGLAGLAVKSGARSTIATLWPIRDQVAANLMIDFYAALKTPGTAKAQALRQAQLKLLAEPGYHNPFFWSPYILVGNWR